MGKVVVHPLRFDHFIAIEKITPDKGGLNRSPSEAINGRLRFHQRRVGGEAGHPDTVTVTYFLHQEGVLLHRE
jgi:hypothetical protein